MSENTYLLDVGLVLEDRPDEPIIITQRDLRTFQWTKDYIGLSTACDDSATAVVAGTNMWCKSQVRTYSVEGVDFAVIISLNSCLSVFAGATDAEKLARTQVTAMTAVELKDHFTHSFLEDVALEFIRSGGEESALYSEHITHVTAADYWATFDGCEHPIAYCASNVIEALGFDPTVAYFTHKEE